jgi:hypothetical protein
MGPRPTRRSELKAAAAVTTFDQHQYRTAAQLEASRHRCANPQAIVDHRQKNGGFKKIEN